MKGGTKKSRKTQRITVSHYSSPTESADIEHLLMHELTAVSHKVAAAEALIAGQLTRALEHIDDAVALYERNPSYAKRSAGEFHTLPELLGACVDAHDEWQAPATLCALELLGRMERLGQARIH